ncbi:MAG: DUF4388 domain-containing protein [Myxococcota bacterium]
MSLRGVLSDFGSADVFQLIAQQQKTGRLQVERAGRVLEVFFIEGSVLRARPTEIRPDGALASVLLRSGAISESALEEAWRAQAETLEPLPQVLVSRGVITDEEIDQLCNLINDETIFELFLWDEGKFAFEPCEVEPARAETPVRAEMVLLDAMRMRDEWGPIQRQLRNLTLVITPRVDLEGFRAKRGELEGDGVDLAALEKLFTLANGRATARRVIDLSRLGTFEGARGLMALIRVGVVVGELRKTTEPGTVRIRRQASRPMLAYAVLGVCAAFAVLLLQLRAPRLVDYPLPAASLEEARAAAATRRLRVALEAHRWAAGGYPTSLAALGDGNARLLATVPLDRYSYVRSEDGYRLTRRLE